MSATPWDVPPRSGTEPRLGQARRYAGRSLRVGTVPPGTCQICREQVTVPEGTRVQTLPPYLGYVPKGWNGSVPLRAGNTPQVLRQCAQAPPEIFTRGFAGIWLRTHANVADQLDVLDSLPGAEATTKAWGLTLPQAVRQGQVQGWVTAAREAIDQSGAALRGNL